ncbi:kinesin family protein [Skeletonema marinoi]|uniref:Kinesin family protein n=1 Tax=Skeletonema marinoi TaxID=267567 RepID=A0AAD8YMW0_9STRA|nr:kinesin family protein [Skeletonema marinoi]
MTMAARAGGGSGGINSPIFMDSPLQEDPIRVCLRLRPVNKLETSRRSTNCVKVVQTAANNNDKSKASYAAILEKGSSATVGNAIEVISPLQGKFNFTFDQVFQEDASQSLVYQHTAAPFASDLLEGFNCALISYGQTGSGKTHTMMGGNSSDGTTTTTTTGKKKSSSNTTSINDEKSGMIHRLIKDIFQQMKESPPSIEYIVRCSFVEIYLEKILDLLNPANRSIQILEEGSGLGSMMGGSSAAAAASSSSSSDGNGGNNGNEGGVRIDGASEACCFDQSDVISLLIRGNACRTVSSTKMNTDSSRSHAIFIMSIEQKDNITGISKMSQLQLIDMAGSELGGKDQTVQGTKGTAIHQEARMINKSLSSLDAVVRAVVEKQDATRGSSGADAAGGSSIETPYSQSKLTRLLRDAFGGNCRTSIILTASPASYSIAESIRTMKFGHLCRSVMNFVKPSVEMSPMDYRKLLNDTQKKQVDMTNLVNELSAECFQLKQDAKSKKFVESNYSGPLWETIESVLVNGADQVANKSIRGGKEPGDSAELAALREELARTRNELQASKKKREHVESLLAERQSEVAILRTQNDNYSSEKKRNHQDLIVAQSENRLLLQRKHEVENNLRTSQFREYEATVFLRQFRRFYRRLLKNKAAQGNGGASEVMKDVPGIPDLKDLIDVDSLLLESGLIEESELHDDTATGTYRPSAQALNRSTESSNEAWREAARQGKVKDLEQFDQLSLGSRSRGGRNDELSHGQLITNRQQLLGTPAGKLTTIRERELERDLLRATERCIELQVALNEEKANVDILRSNMSHRKMAQETIQLKQQLEKKTHDLQQIIWKMNELHLINKTYNEKMSNREQHVTYLEENLVELQGSNRNMILERQEAEEKLREELDNLKVLVDAMTIPLWQFGEAGATSTLSSRIRLPVRGGIDIKEDEDDDAGSSGDLDSLEGSVVSDDDEEEEESDEEDVDDTQSRTTVQIIAQKSVPMRDAAVQACVSVSERGTITDPLISDTPRSLRSDARTNTYAAAKSNSESTRTQDNGAPLKSSPRSRDTATSNGTLGTSSAVSATNNDVRSVSAEDLYRGGKPSSSQPRRSVHKYGLMIRPGVLKEREKPSSK